LWPITTTDIEVDSAIDSSIDKFIVASSITETIVVDPAPLVAESSIIETIVVDSNPLVDESEPEFELNQFFDDDNHISMWIEEQGVGVHGDQEIQGLQDQGVQDRRYPLRQRRPTAKAAGLG
jgi:hypothetical protein